MEQLTFGQLVARARAARGWSQRELGRRAGVTGAAISLIERGDRQPTYHVAKRIAAALGMALADLDPQPEIEEAATSAA